MKRGEREGRKEKRAKRAGFPFSRFSTPALPIHPSPLSSCSRSDTPLPQLHPGRPGTLSSLRRYCHPAGGQGPPRPAVGGAGARGGGGRGGRRGGRRRRGGGVGGRCWWRTSAGLPGRRRYGRSCSADGRRDRPLLLLHLRRARAHHRPPAPAPTAAAHAARAGGDGRAHVGGGWWNGRRAAGTVPGGGGGGGRGGGGGGGGRGGGVKECERRRLGREGRFTGGFARRRIRCVSIISPSHTRQAAPRTRLGVCGSLSARRGTCAPFSIARSPRRACRHRKEREKEETVRRSFFSFFNPAPPTGFPVG